MEAFFTRIASKSASLMGQPAAFIIATSCCIVWAVTGPIFHYSDTWQLVINTGTTVLTFLAVFLIQNSQNRDGSAIQAKLDELMRAIPNARPEFIGIEHLTDAEFARSAKRWSAKRVKARPQQRQLTHRSTSYYHDDRFCTLPEFAAIARLRGLRDHPPQPSSSVISVG